MMTLMFFSFPRIDLLSFVIGVAFLILLRSLGRFTIIVWLPHYRKWFYGLPLWTWFGMQLFFLGAKLIDTEKAAYIKTMNGRRYLSPKCKGFEVEA